VRRAYHDGVVTQRQAPPPPWHPLAWADALTQFGRTETAGGLVLTVALAVALVWANLDTHSYTAVWSHLVTRRSEPVPNSLHTVVADIDNGLMTIFFLAVGLEIGREVAEGSLKDRRNALLPVVGALGGMLGAALIYLIMSALLHPLGGIAQGWGVPMATDVAFALGAIALLGRRVPQPLRIFVLALAVADDVASVIVLAFVGSTTIHPLWLIGALAALVALWLLRRRIRHAWWPYVVAAVGIWYLFVRAGVEPTLAGAFVGILVPVAGGARAGHRLEQPVHLLSSYVVLPLFVLANAGVVLTGAVWHSSGGTSVIASIFAARTLGKALGITVGVMLAVRFGLSNLPHGTTWRHMVGVSLLCGMGLTVALLFAHAVFGSSPLLYAGAQIGLLLGTLGAGLLGATVLLAARPDARRPSEDLGETPRLGAPRATVPAADTPPAPIGGHESSKEG
jgi:Na+:H+ antiporter, NhaA family